MQRVEDPPITRECPPITAEEVKTAAARLPRGKAAGPDGVPNEVLSVVARRAPDLLTRLYNRSLSEAVFPRRWKRARLVLLLKGPDKPLDQPSRVDPDESPLCMLNTVGKLFERILLQRLKEHLDRTGGLSPNQFGFRVK